MVTAEMVKEFEAASAQTTPDAPVTTEASAQAPQTAEELEIMLGGKPFKIPTNAEFPVKHNGQIMRTPLEKLLNSYRQNTHLEDKVKEYRELKTKYEAERGDYDAYQASKKKYGDIQDWSEKNPQEWEKLWDLFQNRDSALTQAQFGTEKPEGGAIPRQFLDEFGNLKKELRELKGWKDTLSAQQEEKETEAQVEQIKGEIAEFGKEWPEIDLNETNLDGISVRGLIMQHGIKRGIGEFKLAALDYFGPRLLEIAQARGRSEAVKGFQNDRQQGIIARSNQPFQMGQSGEPDTTKMSKQERSAAARAEYERLVSQGR